MPPSPGLGLEVKSSPGHLKEPTGTPSRVGVWGPSTHPEPGFVEGMHQRLAPALLLHVFI